MKLSGNSEPSIPKREIFREQALDAWRNQDPETKVLLELSPPWMTWAMAGILSLAAAGVFIAAVTTIPSRASGPASVRPSSRGDTLFVSAVLTVETGIVVRPGQTMLFRPHGPGSKPLEFQVASVLASPASSNAGGARPGISPVWGDPGARLLVRGARPTTPEERESAQRWAGAEMSGSAGVVVATKSLLHLLRPRAPHGKAT